MNDTVIQIQPGHERPEGMNPLIDTHCGAAQTAHNVSCVLQYLQSMDHDKEEHCANDDNWVYGRHLLYGVLITALRYHAAQP